MSARRIRCLKLSFHTGSRRSQPPLAFSSAVAVHGGESAVAPVFASLRRDESAFYVGMASFTLL